jgi:aminopeptidase N
MWYEHIEGSAAFNDYMESLYSYMEAENLHPPAVVSPDDIFNGAVYVRGAWTLHALRLLLGDETFIAILRGYYDRFQYSNASTSDFMDVAEEISGQDLSEFFEAWLFDEAVPPMPE